MIKYLKIIDGKVLEADPAAANIICYINPSEADKKSMIDVYKLDEHTLISSLDPDELSRIEIEPEHMAMIFKRPKNYSSADKFLFKVSSIGMFLFKDRLILVMPEDIPLFDGKLFARVNSLPDVVLKIISRNIQHFYEHLKAINMISNEIENQINTSMENRSLINLFALEKSLVYYLNAISSNSAAIERLRINAVNPSIQYFTSEHIELIDDITIENKQCYEQAAIYSNILASLMDARASIVSNNLNVLMKTLTIVMIGMMWPTLVCAFFSMNVILPYGLNTHPFSFTGIMLFAVGPLFIAFFFWWLKRRNEFR